MKMAEKQITVTNEVDIAVARQMGGDLAELIGFEVVGKHCVMTSISELASNIYFHVGSGTITLRVINRSDSVIGIEVVARDNGQGIEDIAFALRDGTTTRGGLGGGLPGVSRLMSEMQISSTVGGGTVIRAVKWINDPRLPKLLNMPVNSNKLKEL